jgi:hypothetical protein
MSTLNLLIRDGKKIIRDDFRDNFDDYIEYILGDTYSRGFIEDT